ncbi:hypothetical protein ACQRC6_06450 [Peptoniphilus sp. SGI.035]|uniref:hypothetical protein n=1 Tax=Peptoniphilus sp. SGI.035 TaxID=3420564 RepID=UPI003CFCD870|nr:DUF4145 domain-containing protein [Finegoldia magna]
MKTTQTKFFYNNHEHKLLVPSNCPYCGQIAHSSYISNASLEFDQNSKYFIIALQSNCCDKIYIASYLFEYKTQQFTFLNFYPSQNPNPLPENIANISPRFVSMYSQALASERNNHFELAACGYRNSIEILIKDYAIKVLKENPEEVVKKSLFKAIEDYLPKDLLNTADVVRILGNDNTHYLRKYKDIDFPKLKNYLEIFIGQIDTQYKILNPPVSRL